MEVLVPIYSILNIESKNIILLMPDSIVFGEENNGVVVSGKTEFKHFSSIDLKDGEMCYVNKVSIDELKKNGDFSKDELINFIVEKVNSVAFFIENGELNELDKDEFEKKYNLVVDYEKKLVLKRVIKSFNDVIDSIESKILFQSDAVKRIVSIIANNKFLENKKNIVLLGSKGVGKTKTVDLVAREFCSPYAKINEFSGEGLINSYLTLFMNSDEEDLFGPPIIFIDGINRGIKKLERIDGDILVEMISNIVNKKSKFPLTLSDEKTVLFDSNDIVYIIALDLDKIIDFPNVTGFGKDEEKLKKEIIMNLREMLVDANCEIIDMNDLSENDLRVILEKSEISPINEYKKILDSQNIKLNVSKKAYELLSKEAYKLNKGAKGLSIVTDYVLRDDILDAQFNCKDMVSVNSKKVLKKVNDPNFKNKLY